MALNTAQQDLIVKTVVGVFDAAPGATYLNLLAPFGSNQTALVNALVNTDGFKAIYPDFYSNEQFATKFLDALVGSTVNATDKGNVATYAAALLNGGASRANVVLALINALDNVPATDATWGAASKAFDNQVTVAKYYTINQLGSATSIASLQSVIAGVTNTTDVSSNAAIEAAIANSGNSNGQSLTLTTGIDNIVGTAGNDTVLGSDASGATALVLGGLDVIDGGAGTDTLKIADAATAAGGNFSFNGATIKNVESIEVTTNGSFDVAANTGLSLKGYTGLTSATLKAAGTDNSLVLAADTTDVNLTVAGTATAGVTGGKAVSVTAGTGVVTVAGDALTSVTVKGGTAGTTGGAADVTNTVSGAGNTGATLKSVTIDGVATGGTFEIAGAAVDTVTVKNQQAALATAITNATSTSLTVNVDAAGYNAAGTGVAVSVAAGAAATTINLNAVSKSNVAVSGAAATTLNITGAGALTLSAPITTATKIDGSAATGNLTLGTLNAATVTAKTGSGNDSLTLSATTKATVDTGAGDDAVTLASAVAAGSTITLGAGNDKLLVSTGSVAASTATAVTTIDAGDGTDTVAAALINAANAAQFKNFENIDVSSATATALDVELITGSTITGLTLSGGTGGATVNNVAAGVGLTVTGNNTGAADTVIGVKGAAAGTADSFTVTFAGTAAATATATAHDLTAAAASAVTIDKVENITLASGGTGFVTNVFNLKADTGLQTLTITGDKDLNLTFTGVNGTNAAATGGAVKLIDGSAATGVLNINTTNVVADNKVGVGLTVKGGSAGDTITLAQAATVDAGAGDDIIHASAAGGTFTGGVGKDLFDVSNTGVAIGGAITEAGGVIKTTITDIAAGDTIQLDAASLAVLNKVTLDNTVTNLDQALALASNNSVAGTISWFQYGTNTYIVENSDGTTGIDAATATPTAGDIVVKLTGLVDLTNSTVAAHVITIV